MPELSPEIEGLSVVLVGSFNPKIFHPSWFAAEGLIRKEEAETANLEVTHPSVAIFSLDWLRLEVTQERFAAATSNLQQYAPEPLRDLVQGTFNLLRHSPARMMGINRHFHFGIESEEKWHAIGDQLAPKKIWEGVLEGRPGMRSLLIEVKRPDRFNGYIRVKVEPSTSVKKSKYGVFVEINDHFALDQTVGEHRATELMDILDSVWTESLERSCKIAYTVLEKTL